MKHILYYFMLYTIKPLTMYFPDLRVPFMLSLSPGFSIVKILENRC